jgi:hypothetical protein
MGIDGLHAQRARDVIAEHRYTKTVSNGSAEVAGPQDGVVAIFLRRDSSDEPTRVLLLEVGGSHRKAQLHPEPG